MKVPVYGFEKNYEVSDEGVVYSLFTNKPLIKAPQASLRTDRVRLSDKKYYDVKYLVFKSFNPNIRNIEINDERIIFIDGNCRNNNLSNLKLLNNNSREEICLMLQTIYQVEFRPLIEYKNYYISKTGMICSVYRSTAKVIKPYVGTDGYLQVKIPDNYGADVHVKIHKCVAKTFVKNPNPNEFNVVHHKDENKLNNNADNLEWTTLKQNTVYSIGKKCCMLDQNYSILSIHDSISDLSREYRVDSSTASKQCNGKKKQFTSGLKARFFNENTHNFISTIFD